MSPSDIDNECSVSKEPLSRAEMAVQLFMSGRNCAQAVAGAFSDVIGLPQDAVLALSAGFGGGMGDHRGTCGAVAGVCLVVGAAMKGFDPEDIRAKRELYAEENALKDAFFKDFGSLSCPELLKRASILPPPVASERTREYYAARPCARFVGRAAEILESWLKARSQA